MQDVINHASWHLDLMNLAVAKRLALAKWRAQRDLQRSQALTATALLGSRASEQVRCTVVFVILGSCHCSAVYCRTGRRCVPRSVEEMNLVMVVLDVISAVFCRDGFLGGYTEFQAGHLDHSKPEHSMSKLQVFVGFYNKLVQLRSKLWSCCLRSGLEEVKIPVMKSFPNRPGCSLVVFQ